MYSENEVARRLRGVVAESLPEELRGQQEEPISNTGNPVLERFPTYQLKAELRRRRREGGLFRWILWRLKWM